MTSSPVMTTQAPFSSKNLNGVFRQTVSVFGGSSRPPPSAIHFDHRRSMFAWCAQKIGSRAASSTIAM